MSSAASWHHDQAESARIEAVRRYEILETPPDGAFDRIAAVAARAFGVPIGIVSIVDTDRIWFKSHHGLPEVEEIGRDPGLCASAILQNEPWIVTDAAIDPRTLANPLVQGAFGLRFYAGVPLTTPDGFNLGTLCVLDTEPREITDAELETLKDLAGVVVGELELRLSSRLTVQREFNLRTEAEQLAEALQASLLPPGPPEIAGMELATRYQPGSTSLRVGGDFFDVFRLASNDWAVVLGDACGKGPRAASVAGLSRWSVRASAVHHLQPRIVLEDLNTVLCADRGEDDNHFCSVVFARLELDICGAWVTFASGGHPLPLLLRAAGVVDQRGQTGLPVGMFDTVGAVDERVGIGPGDALVFYTDGITETRNIDGEIYGDRRLRALLRECCGRPADDIADAIVNAAQDFGDGPSDDVAVVVVRVPDDLGQDPMERIATATGVPAAQLRLSSRGAD